MKGAIIYQSRKGKTKKMGEEIGTFLKKNGIDITISSIDQVAKNSLNDLDFVFLGCWTQGLFIMGQHPENEWVRFVKELPDLSDKKVGLFATYSLATGSMFKNMKKAIPNANGNIALELKSRNGDLSVTNKLDLLGFIK